MIRAAKGEGMARVSVIAESLVVVGEPTAQSCPRCRRRAVVRRREGFWCGWCHRLAAPPRPAPTRPVAALLEDTTDPARLAEARDRLRHGALLKDVATFLGCRRQTVAAWAKRERIVRGEAVRGLMKRGRPSVEHLLAPEALEAVRERVRAGEPLAWIAADVGCSAATMQRWVRREGLTRAAIGDGARMDRAQRERVVAVWRATGDLDAAAAAVGATRRRVRAVLKRRGLVP